MKKLNGITEVFELFTNQEEFLKRIKDGGESKRITISMLLASSASTETPETTCLGITIFHSVPTPPSGRTLRNKQTWTSKCLLWKEEAIFDFVFGHI